MLRSEICVACKLPLSITPVWKRRDDARVCGRCLDGSTRYPNYTRDVDYEESATTSQFSCRYSSLGCEEILEFDSKDHEKTCRLNCVSIENLNEYFRELNEHKFGGILEKSMLSIKELERDIHYWYVYNIFSLSFYLHTGIISNRLIFDIGFVDRKKIASDIKYRIIIGGQSGTENFLTLAQTSISTNMKYFPDLYGTNTVNYESAVDLLGHTDLYWHIHISTPNYIFHDRKINLTAISCPKCSVSMTPPIFKCVEEHVICEDCAEEKDGVGWCYACPQVKMRFPNTLKNNSNLQQIHRYNKQRVCLTRCSSLENQSKWVSPLPCRWPCDHVTENIRSHEKECTFRIYSCSWWCDYNGNLEDLKAHMQKKHQDKLLFSSGEACINGKEDNKKFIIISNRDLFTVSMSTTSFGKEFYVCYKTPQVSIQSEYTCKITIHNFESESDSKVFQVPFYKKFDITQDYLKTFNEDAFYISVKINIKED